MRILEKDGVLTGPAQLLLAAVAQAPPALLAAVRVLPRRFNWLGFPWYRRRHGGGAFVLVDRIYASGNFFDGDGTGSLALLHLLAHEVGHLRHAAPFAGSPMGKLRFVGWAAGHYARSYARHGRTGYRKARIEQEAERGRWVLRQLIRSEGIHALTGALKDEVRMRAWLERNAPLLDRLHGAYRGW